ncbi:MAG: sulfite exporter TauE/SafE family protein [Candidatus Eremiobacteraeota bacterium]|nr:sulfite exporter TauE/SafE family protein [Candidatus Eremiobacteraeota bacterium]
MTLLEAAAFIALGLVAGSYGTLIGVGGGLLVVPALLLMHAAPKEAAGSSMAVVLANAVSGSLTYLRQRRIDVRAGLIFALAGLPGALLGGFVDQNVPKRLFSLLFALLLAGIGLRLVLRPGRDEAEAAIADGHSTAGFRPGLAALIGLGTGFLASMFGIGGGLIFVPSLVYMFAFPAHVATATSTFIIALTALFGTASHAYYHDVLWGPTALIASGAIAGAQVGARLAPRVRGSQLLRIFAVAVLLVALWLFYKAVG